MKEHNPRPAREISAGITWTSPAATPGTTGD